MISLEKIQANRGRGWLSILKAVMGPDWSFQKGDGLIAYKDFILPLFGYASPVFYPIRSKLKAPVDRFQDVQNTALRVSTGCHAAASV
jgi:hypothetical protein